MANSGDVCPRCGRGRMRTVSSRQCGDSQMRYVECQCCRHREKSIVPAVNVWRRSTVVRKPA